MASEDIAGSCRPSCSCWQRPGCTCHCSCWCMRGLRAGEKAWDAEGLGGSAQAAQSRGMWCLAGSPGLHSPFTGARPSRQVAHRTPLQVAQLFWPTVHHRQLGTSPAEGQISSTQRAVAAQHGWPSMQQLHSTGSTEDGQYWFVTCRGSQCCHTWRNAQPCKQGRAIAALHTLQRAHASGGAAFHTVADASNAADWPCSSTG